MNNSFNELNVTNNAASKYMSSREKNKNIVGSYIDVINNKIVIEMLIDRADVQEKLKSDLSKYNNYVNYDTIKYTTVDQPKIYSTTIKSGGKILARRIDENYVAVCSMGFRTKYNNRYGYVTAGHCLKNATSIQSGTVLYNRFDNNQK